MFNNNVRKKSCIDLNDQPKDDTAVLKVHNCVKMHRLHKLK